MRTSKLSRREKGASMGKQTARLMPVGSSALFDQDFCSWGVTCLNQRGEFGMQSV